jgi:hypothetical protein
MVSITTLEAGSGPEDGAKDLIAGTAAECYRESSQTAGIPVGVNAAPIIPGLTDEELPTILKAAADHGATQRRATFFCRLPGAVESLCSWTG